MSEFIYLPAQAAAAGVAVPAVRRTSFELPDGRTVSALRYGDGDPLITFLHGAGLNAHTWDTTILAAGLPALAIDLPGHGDSSWREDAGYTGRTLAADIAPAVSAWTRTPQVVVGQSLGGLTGAALAATHPELVRALVVVDITPGIDPNGGAADLRRFFAGPTDWASREELTARALAFGLGGTPEAAARGVHLNSRVRPDGRVEWKHHYARIANALAADPDAAAGADAQQRGLAAILSATGWDDLAAVAAPITLVRGDRGFVTAADAAEFRTRVPAAEVVELSAGHNVQEQQPGALGRLAAGLTAAS